MAIPSPSAPRIVGMGFSRTKYSVRSRARPAFSFVSSHVWLIAVEIFLVARRNCSRPHEDYAAAYRTGYEGFHKYPGRPYQEIENELALDYQRSQPGAALPWDHARHAVHAAWAKLSHDVAPRDPDRGIRSGM